MSTRYDIMTQVISALTNITIANEYNSDVKSVDENLKHWEQVNHADFPALFPIDADEAKEPFAIGASGENMQGTLTIIVTGMIYDKDGDARRLARTNLMQDIEKAMVTHAGIAALILDIRPMRIVTDKGLIPNFSVWDQEFTIEYLYNRDTGG